MIEEPFSEQNGLVNSTLKIVKHKVYETYADRIASLYTVEGKQADSPGNIEALREIL